MIIDLVLITRIIIIVKFFWGEYYLEVCLWWLSVLVSHVSSSGNDAYCVLLYYWHILAVKKNLSPFIPNANCSTV